MARKAEGPQKPLDAEDWELWRRVAAGAQPLARKRPAPVAKPTAKREAAAKPVETKESQPGSAGAPAMRQPAPPARPALPELQPGAAAGVDARTAERLRRGQLPIEARIDLHGHTQDEAHGELGAFIERAWRARKRCLLVITGKGRPAKDAMGGGPRGGNEGVLRRAVPRWLNEPGLRARVLAIAPAQAKDGGGGALYVLLKRQRESAS